MCLGTKIWFIEWRANKELWLRGTIKSVDAKGQYYVITDQSGQQFRRNRVHIRRDQTMVDDSDDDINDTTFNAMEDKTVARGSHGTRFCPIYHDSVWSR